MSTNKSIIGAIVKQSAGDLYCFKTCFTSKEAANKYKDMLFWIIQHDNYKVLREHGLNDLHR